MTAAETSDQSEAPLEPITDPAIIERLVEALRETQRITMAKLPPLKHTDLSPGGVLPAESRRSDQNP
jgi:hypothetical protein